LALMQEIDHNGLGDLLKPLRSAQNRWIDDGIDLLPK
jgi:hypothetical protein